MTRRSIIALTVVAMGLGGCGGSDDRASEQAVKTAAQGYVSDFGKRDGRGVCEHMTKERQAQFTASLIKANPELRGQRCPEVMQRVLDTLPDEQVRRFAAARIADVKVDGDTASFRYRLGTLRIDGKVSREGDVWRVSCCVPGQDGG
jgi:hypothetical protein